jgi:Rrf2 family iron-sulfur cluster assembly transcriptional regulator
MQTFLSQTAEYALRAMARIAAQGKAEPLRASDLSVETRIPQQYLSKILRRLVLAGILVSKKGRGGGFTLARPPSRIILRDVLAAVDAYPQEGRCAFGLHACSRKHPCALHDGWCRLSDDFHRWATKTTFNQMRTSAPEFAVDRARVARERLLPVARTGSRLRRRSGDRTTRTR